MTPWHQPNAYYLLHTVHRDTMQKAVFVDAITPLDLAVPPNNEAR